MNILTTEIHLHYFRFDDLKAQLDEYSAYLSPDETQRAAKFHFEADQNRFKISRGKLRKLVSEYLNCNPLILKFEYGEHGKPYLSDKKIEFNLAHTKHAFLIGLTVGDAIGVDLEYCDRNLDAQALSRQIMSSLEKKYFESLPLDQHKEAFLRAWTRKEAFVKAVGIGLNADLKNLTLTVNQRESLSFEYDNQTWQVVDLPKQDHHFLAFSVQSDIQKLTKFFTKTL